MVVGVLFLLTLTAFISLPEIYGRVLIGVFTLVIIFPFVASAAILLLAKNEKKKEKVRRRMWWLEKVLGAHILFGMARIMTLFGFFFFVLYLGGIVLYPLIGTPIIEDVEQQCAKSPKTFNVTADPWKCSKFSPGSLAERCAKDPDLLM